MNVATCIHPIVFPLPSIRVASPHPVSASSVSSYPRPVTVRSPPHNQDLQSSLVPPCTKGEESTWDFPDPDEAVITAVDGGWTSFLP